MKILFLTLLDFDSLEERNIYTDLMREFAKHDHSLYIVSPIERRKKQETRLIEEGNVTILKLKIGNTQKTNIIEKGISTITIEPIFIRGIKKYFSNIKFDLVLYSTPPITFCKAVEYLKKRDGAVTYLLLKDIFPQNAVDIGILSKRGVKGLLYRYFRNKEKKLYSISDYIGCMSQANVDYVLKHNPQIMPNKVEICPNCIEVDNIELTDQEKVKIREKYGIPQDKTVFIYGGNLGKPQGIPFIIECLKTQEQNAQTYFVVVGDGTEYHTLEAYFNESKPDNMKLMRRLPKEDFELLVAACDIGMIFLEHRFTIPNFPSRLLTYMQAKVPVLAVTDVNTDIGKIIVQNGFGWWCESDDSKKFEHIVEMNLNRDKVSMAEQGFCYLKEHYSVETSYSMIIRKCVCNESFIDIS